MSSELSPLSLSPSQGDLASTSEGALENPAMSYLLSLQSSRSRQTMHSFLNIVAKLLGSHDLKSCPWHLLKRQHIQAILDQLLAAGRSPATVNTYLAALKGVALESWAMGLIDTDTFQHIRQVKSIRGSRVTKGRALRNNEIKKLFTTIEQDSSPKGIRDDAIVAVLLGCGLRRAELVALDLVHIDQVEQLFIVTGKGNKQRKAFIPDQVWEKLLFWIQQVRGEYPGPLFTRIRRFDDVTLNRLSDQAVYHILKLRQDESGIAPFAPHDLRRTFASMMLENGEDIVTVKDAMGHASITTTQRYDKRGDERLRRASKRLFF